MYRFDEIKGYEEVIQHFQNAIKLNKISHAYIIEGESGKGKKRLANTYAKVMQCQAHGIEACDACRSCHSYDSGNHPDVIHIRASKKTGIGVDDIREQVNKDVFIKPYVYDYKIYIIHEAEKMTIQAQNALLKTLEEPPIHVRFILLATHTHTFLSTILSRCVVIRLRALRQTCIEDYLEKDLGVPDYQAKLYASFARGNMGRALALRHSESFHEMRKDMIQVMTALSNNDKVEAMAQVEVFEKYKDEKQDFLDLMLTWLRDLMVIKSLGDLEPLIHMDNKNLLLKQVPYLSYNRISSLIEGIEQIRKYDRLHINFTLLVEVMLIQAMNSK
ncbi:MAG: DNA polymerase III subunit delta' [Vallitaleaceae bacterium]|nr:DNA polymerase III subunit delta' [Vallitaleaceae bacterium]